MRRAGAPLFLAVTVIVFPGCSDGPGSSATDGGLTGSTSTATTLTGEASTSSSTQGPGTSPTATSTASAGETTSGAADSSSGGGGSSTTGPVDFCGGALFCEDFEDYDAVELENGEQIGPWAVVLNGDNRGMDIDSSRATSGAKALHVFLEAGTDDAGGRLRASGDLPVLAGNPTHLYGRMMMYLEPVATSVHWSFFRLVGEAEPGSPVAPRSARYLLSSLSDSGYYSFVYGLEASGGNPFVDCSQRQDATLLEGTWTCVSFELDSVNRQLRMWLDGAADPAVEVDNTGQQCVGDVPNDTPWYGPAAEEFFLGAQTFHPMSGRLDVWFDDVVLDVNPLPCPPR